jgi:hypothetical protein
MKMNAGGWIGMIGGLIGLIVGVGAVITTGGPAGVPIAIGMIVIFGGMFLLFYKLFFGPMINASRLLKNGIDGKATITQVNDTGVTINNNPQVKLTVDVKNMYGQKYTTTIRTLVSRINPFVFQPGMEVPVKIDPNNEKNVVINTSLLAGVNNNNAAGSTIQVNQEAMKQELETMLKENEALLLTGRPARAIVKKYHWLGVNVNGNNPYVSLDIEVLPENGIAFSATARGVIGEAAVPKYQPGSEIFVKYDLYDNSRVVLDHS